jgi:hypothetical protein
MLELLAFDEKSPFDFFCLIWVNKARLALFPQIKQKYQKWIIDRKLTVATSEREGKPSNPRGRAPRARCMEKIYGNLRKPARLRRARAMYRFPRSQRYSTPTCTISTVYPRYPGYPYSCTTAVNLVLECTVHVHTAVLNLVLLAIGIFDILNLVLSKV